MLQKSTLEIPIVTLIENADYRISIKREDLIHPFISGNKYWKLFHNVNAYLDQLPENPMIITFGGAFSNHIAAVSAFGHENLLPTLGIIRGDELRESWQNNPTLLRASHNGMKLRFVTREIYRDKDAYSKILQQEFPNALIIPEGGTNEAAVEGIKYMLNDHTKDFDYLCTAVGTGGTISGLSKYAEHHQKVVGCSVVKDISLPNVVKGYSNRGNVVWQDASYGGYGKIKDDIVRFVNAFKSEHNILLDPIYTGKMMKCVLQLAHDGFFPKGSNILCFHTGGLQGIEGANRFLKSKNKPLIEE